jgi:F-type H+-transporting ATPase subunit delta
MNQSKVAVRYAKAYYETCVEQNCLESGHKDIEVIANAISSISDLRLILNDPITKPSIKIAALETLLSDKVSDLTIKFVRLVLINKRESDLASIARSFLLRYKVATGFADVTLVSALQLDNASIDQIKIAVQRNFNVKADFEISVDADLIGGFILRVDDIQYDSSVATKLKNIKKTLLN